MIRAGFTFAALAALVAVVSTTPLKFEEVIPVERSSSVYRLPTSVTPLHYDLALVPYITDLTFVLTGTVTINVTVSTATNVIFLHTDDLTVTSSTVRNATNSLNIISESYDAERHFYILAFATNIPAGNYSVALSFTGHLRDDMAGFYRSYYDVGNERRWLAATQFQATSARRAFPCFDEPALKATFSIRIAHFTNQTAASNMPVQAISGIDNAIGGRVWTQFETTPVMSTYLLAFVVSDLARVSNADGTFNIWARRDALDAAQFALIYGEQQYRAIADALNVSDSVPKIDQFAIPDFSAGAMENWGLIIYRERLLLWKDGESTPRNQEDVATVMSHEFGHNWFGNLVTLEWWDTLWLNEGFATFFQYFGTSLVHPEWRLMEKFAVYVQQTVMIADSLETTRPMTNSVDSPASIWSSFDGIAYSKAASVIRMMSHVMTESLFLQALQNFLVEKNHSTATPEDLWRHMQVVADNNSAVQNHIYLDNVFGSWVNQAGYPLVTITRNYSTTVLFVSQERFFLNPDTVTAASNTQRWWIPLNFATQALPGRFATTTAADWLRPQDDAIAIGGFAPTNWVVFNSHQSGYYRVNYDVTNWNLLTNFLKGANYTVIPPVNRASLVDDSFNLARAGYISYTIPLELSSYLVQETDYVPWQAAWNVFTHLNRMLASHTCINYWRAYVQRLITPLHDSLTWGVGAADDHLTRLHRGQILDWACNIGQPSCRRNATEIFNAWIANPSNSVPASLKPVVYCYGIKSASEGDWDVAWQRFLATDLSTEETLLLSSLGCTENPTLINRYLTLSITPNSGIRSQDTYLVFNSVVAGGAANLEVALDFVINNYPAISEFYGGMGSIGSMLAGIANRITREDQIKKLREFVESNDLGAGTAAGQRAVATGTNNVAWIEERAVDIVDWLHEQDLDLSDFSSGASTFTISFLAASLVAFAIVRNYMMA